MPAVAVLALVAIASHAAGGQTRPGVTFASLFDFGTHLNDGVRPNCQLVVGPDGNFYGSTAEGGTHGAGTIFRATPSGQVATLYSLNESTDGGYPQGPLVIDADGNLYGTATLGGANGYGTVFKVTPLGAETTLYTFLGTAADGRYPAPSFWTRLRP